MTEKIQMIQQAAGIVIAVLTTAGTWMVLEKMGEKGWKALIPFYNNYLLFKNAWNRKMFWMTTVLSVISVIGLIAALTAMITGAEGVVVMTAIGVMAAAGIATTIISLIFFNKLSKAFGHGMGYTLGLAVFPEIFLPIIGFGKSAYAAAQ